MGHQGGRQRGTILDALVIDVPRHRLPLYLACPFCDASSEKDLAERGNNSTAWSLSCPVKCRQCSVVVPAGDLRWKYRLSLKVAIGELEHGAMGSRVQWVTAFGEAAQSIMGSTPASFIALLDVMSKEGSTPGKDLKEVANGGLHEALMGRRMTILASKPRQSGGGESVTASRITPHPPFATVHNVLCNMRHPSSSSSSSSSPSSSSSSSSLPRTTLHRRPPPPSPVPATTASSPSTTRQRHAEYWSKFGGIGLASNSSGSTNNTTPSRGQESTTPPHSRARPLLAFSPPFARASPSSMCSSGRDDSMLEASLDMMDSMDLSSPGCITSSVAKRHSASRPGGSARFGTALASPWMGGGSASRVAPVTPSLHGLSPPQPLTPCSPSVWMDTSGVSATPTSSKRGGTPNGWETLQNRNNTPRENSPLRCGLLLFGPGRGSEGGFALFASQANALSPASRPPLARLDNNKTGTL